MAKGATVELYRTLRSLRARPNMPNIASPGLSWRHRSFTAVGP
jgi:hypothetical protein